ncbi:MAG: chemotaxis protein CheW [Gloeobacterales cyanobacterium]
MQTMTSAKSVEEAYLVFQLGTKGPVALPMASAEEVLTIRAQQVTPMPLMPAYVLGLFNRRSRVSWVVDLSMLLGFKPLEMNAQQYTIIKIQAEGIPLSLAVQQVRGVIRLSNEQIQASLGTETPTAELSPYLRGYLPHGEGILTVLDAAAIVSSPLWNL